MTDTSKFETLNSLNSSTGKFAEWCVRVLDPEITTYTFTARNKVVKATRFQCVLVTKDPKQCMLAKVPFDFKDRTPPQKLMRSTAINLFGK